MNLTVEHVLMFALVFCAFYYLKNRCGCKEGMSFLEAKLIMEEREAERKMKALLDKDSDIPLVADDAADLPESVRNNACWAAAGLESQVYLYNMPNDEWKEDPHERELYMNDLFDTINESISTLDFQFGCGRS